MALRRLLALPLAALAFAQQPTATRETFHGRPAWVLANGRLRVAVLSGGGHLAEIRLTTGDPRRDVNPMRIPHYPTIDPHTYDPARHDALYGANPHRWLSAGYMGHLLCFPFYGPPSSDDEIRAGLGNHGEAPITRWQEIEFQAGPQAAVLRYAAELEKTAYRVERRVTLAAQARSVRVEEWIENRASYDRPFQWMQHATFGPPFIEPGQTLLDASVTRGMVAGGAELAWSDAQRPMRSQPKSGGYVAYRTDPGRATQFFTLFHHAYRVLIGYVFPSEGFPWLADWQENRRSTVPPWNGQVVARGVEFGNSPFAEGLRKAVERATLFDTPAYSWIGARARRRVEFTVFLAEIPEGFRGVADVRTTSGDPEAVPR